MSTSWMPNGAEWFLIFSIIALVFAGSYMRTMGDFLGRSYQRLVGKADER